MKDLPSGWIETTLGNVCTKPQYGWTTTANPDGNGVRLLRTTDITTGVIDWGGVPFCTQAPPDADKYLLAVDDIVVSRAGSVGASVRISSQPPPAVFASYLIRFRTLPGIEPSYVGWYLTSPRYWRQVAAAAAGIALQNINAKKLAALTMPLPPTHEQRRIVEAIEEHLSRLDAAEESLARANRRLRRLLGIVLEVVWEGDWPTVPIRTIGRVVTGSTPLTARPEYWGSGTSFITPGDLVPGRPVRSSKRSLTAEGIKVARPLPAGSVLVTCIGATIGKTSVAAMRCATNQQINTVVVDETMMSPRFLLFALASPRGQRDIIDASSSTTMPILNKSRFSRLKIPLPPLNHQRRTIEQVEQRLSLIDELSDTIDRARRRSAALRRSILERAFRGELVPQDSTDEPASVLVERIAAEHAADQDNKGSEVLT